MKISKLVAAFAVLFAVYAHADERLASASQLLREGYLPVTAQPSPTLGLAFFTRPRPGFSYLAWPVEFADAAHTVGNSMFEYQSYSFGEAYYHGGCDLRTVLHGVIRAPVTGKIQAQHYSYEIQPDGSAQKFGKPWPQAGESLYFEVSITTADGFRFEIHHVDRVTLTPEVVSLLNSAGTIEAGTQIAQSVEWPEKGIDGQHYHHVHYNIFSPEGATLNPEALSQLLIDTTPPIVHGLYGMRGTQVVALSTHEGIVDLSGLTEVIVATTDKKNGSVYTQPPVKIQLQYPDGTISGWDFSQMLRAPDGTWPALNDVYLSRLHTPDGRTLATSGNYYENFFLIRLKVVAGQTKAKLFVADQAGNAAVLQ